MAENTSPAKCTDAEWEAARAAGLLFADLGSTAQERAFHAFAEAIRDQAAAACATVLDMKEEARALQASRDAAGTPEELDRLKHWATVSTFNAGVRRCIAAIKASPPDSPAA
jgi:membrane protein required for beta-lactamase induction